MARKNKTKPILKAGDWITISEKGYRNDHFQPLWGRGPFLVTRLSYHAIYESQPSPWEVHIQTDIDHNGQLFEEFVRLDVFMTAAHQAVERRPRAPKKAHTAQV